MKLTTRPCKLPRFSMCGAVTPRPLAPLRHVTETSSVTLLTYPTFRDPHIQYANYRFTATLFAVFCEHLFLPTQPELPKCNATVHVWVVLASTIDSCITSYWRRSLTITLCSKILLLETLCMYRHERSTILRNVGKDRSMRRDVPEHVDVRQRFELSEGWMLSVITGGIAPSIK